MRRGWLKAKEIRFHYASKLSEADNIWVLQFRWQIVPDSRSGNRKVCRQNCSVSEERCMFCSWLIEGDAVRCQGEAGHHPPSTDGPWADSDLIVRHRPVWTALVDALEASATDVALAWWLCSCHLAPVISRAAAFCTDCTLRIKLSATPYINELHCSPGDKKWTPGLMLSKW